MSGIAGLSPKATKRFRREAELTARLDHPNICTTYDFGESDGIPWIAMRYVEGETLSARIAAARSPVTETTSDHLSFAHDGGRPPTPDSGAVDPPTVATARTRDEISWVIRVIEQTARALHVAHESGIIHRDIKPANIMVAADGSPVILDFGLANVMEPSGPTVTRTGDLMGTPQYMAPEQLARDRIEPDRRADVYSLGVTLYEALTLTRPFDAPTRERLYQAIIAKEPPDPHRMNAAISRDLSAVVATAIEKDRDRRYQTALLFADDLRRVLGHEPVIARRAGPVHRLTRWAQRNPTVAGSLASLFLVLVAGLVVTILLLGRTNEALDAKEHALTELERLSDVKRLDDLRLSAATLFPSVPANLDAMNAWMRGAEDLVSRLPLHRAALAELDARAPADPARTRYEDKWRRGYLADLILGLERFADPDPTKGVMADVARRIEIARTVPGLSIEAHAERWRLAAASIADLGRSPKYGGLPVAPQLGLVPLGQNPATGLWEFAEVISGSLPETDGRVASFTLEESNGVVLVLLPGGPFRMGSPEAEARHAPDEVLHDVRMKPFFVGKYEVTQAQWERVMGSNPSSRNAGYSHGVTSLHPVETVEWAKAQEFARRLNLVLPSETEWEYACRAGATTAFTWGDDPDVLKGRANVVDRAFREAEPSRGTVIDQAQWNDGFPYHAPVDLFEQNAFGLHGLHGNVGEWCRDWYRTAPEADVPADGGSAEGASPQKCWRDGSWVGAPLMARAAGRHAFAPATKVASVGFRVARALEPAPR
jgi:formylglycine-generating enzyme required for sulfatase activity